MQDLFLSLYFGFDYDFKDEGEYYRILEEIAEISSDWLKTKTVSTQFISKLNILNSKIGDRSLPFYDFCYILFDDLLDELKEKQTITQCSFCGTLFPYHRTRKYCSLRTEGRDCGTKARNRRYYAIHREEILPKAKKSTKELRD